MLQTPLSTLRKHVRGELFYEMGKTRTSYFILAQELVTLVVFQCLDVQS